MPLIRVNKNETSPSAASASVSVKQLIGFFENIINLEKVISHDKFNGRRSCPARFCLKYTRPSVKIIKKQIESKDDLSTECCQTCGIKNCNINLKRSRSTIDIIPSNILKESIEEVEECSSANTTVADLNDQSVDEITSMINEAIDEATDDFSGVVGNQEVYMRNIPENSNDVLETSD